jgi:hypothetical protein
MSNAWWALRLRAAEDAFEDGNRAWLLRVIDEMLEAISRSPDTTRLVEARAHLRRARRYAERDDLGLARAAYVKARARLP